ncbi:dynactin-like protein subunit 2 [Lophium mytilinum]|uniref:Dynactin-like protein subunit 2 n=1 Tax=Lophium mytilinum TaxID=390894 RepID=A0A6A6R2C3_9PEZI|nr:dynactin-like protein subunit 2 [Lophium mytilinum]
MAQGRKYENLPDLDSAPDIYETPELTEDNSTIAVLHEESDQEHASLSHRHLQTEQARTHFQPARVDARDVDFSDRINGQQRSYRTTSQRRRGDELGDPSDEEDEDLISKVDRLREEVARVKVEFAKEAEKRKAQGTSDPELAHPFRQIIEMSDELDEVYVQQQHGGVKGAEAQLARAVDRLSVSKIPKGQSQTQSDAPAPYNPPQRLEISHALSKAAEFDARLASLEEALGIDGTNMPQHAERPPDAILYTLNSLEQVMSTLSAASTSSLDTASKSVRKLVEDADRLEELRKSTSGDNAVAKGTIATEGLLLGHQAEEQVAKINALYGMLDTIETLSPTLPLVLDRLRELRLIHTSAGTADAILKEIEERQSNQEAEIKQWQGSLEDMEKKLLAGESTMTENVKGVGEWVKDLETRIEKLS